MYKHILHAPQHNSMFFQHDILKIHVEGRQHLHSKFPSH